MISIIAALGEDRVIGSDTSIPWHLPADFIHFKKTTIGHPVVMGLNTLLSIGRPLPGRTNIVLTNRVQTIDGCSVATSLNEAFDIARASDEGEEIFIIGGAFVYKQTIDLADRLYITFVDGHFNGNKFFPVIDSKKWREVSRRRKESDEQNKYSMDFVVFNRVTARSL